MAADKPVIGTINGATQEVINKSKYELCINASDSNALVEAMKNFIENSDKYEDCDEKGREYFNSIPWKTYLWKNLKMY